MADAPASERVAEPTFADLELTAVSGADGTSVCCPETDLVGEATAAAMPVEKAQRVRENFILIAVLLAIFGGLNNGYNLIVMAEAIERLKWGGIVNTDIMEGIAMASLQIGMLPGLTLSAWAAEIYGRRRTVVLGELIVVAGSVVQVVSSGIGVIICGRLVLGVGMGICLLMKPLYVAELSPVDIRGRLLVLFSVFTSIGTNFCGLIGAAFPRVPSESFSSAGEATKRENDFIWRALLTLGVIPSMVLIVVAMFCAPESPLWLEERKRCASSGAGDPGASEGLRSGVTSERGLREAGGQQPSCCTRFFSLFRGKTLRQTMVSFFYVSMWTTQGSAAITAYRNSVLDFSTGPGARGYIIALGVAHLLGLVCAMPVIDSFGRRPLIAVGVSCGSVALLVGGISMQIGVTGAVPGLAVVLMIFFAQLGPTACLYSVTTEVYDTEHRATGMAASYYLMLIIYLLINLAYPSGVSVFGHAGWQFIFLGCSVPLAALVLYFYEDTRGKDLGFSGA